MGGFTDETRGVDLFEKQFADILEFKKHLRTNGWDKAVYLTARTFFMAENLVFRSGTPVQLPKEETTYMEGLLGLRLSSLDGTKFVAIHAGEKECLCGRENNFLDVVATAVKRQIHPVSQIRETLTVGQRIFEMADDNGRHYECINCGRARTMRGYSTCRGFSEEGNTQHSDGCPVGGAVGLYLYG